MPDEAPKDENAEAADAGARAGDFERYALIAALTLVVLCLLIWDRWHSAPAARPPAPRPDRTLRVEMGGDAPAAKPDAPREAPRTSPDPSPRPAPPPAPAPRTYVVKSGDTLYDIAKRELGSASRVQDIVSLNAEIGDGSKLKPGQTIVLPSK